MNSRDVEVLAVGAGPSNLALGIALEELAPDDLARNSVIIEQHENILWQRGLLIPWAQSQVSFLKDLVTLRNPRSEFTFLNYLHSVGRLDQFVNLATFTPYRSEISDYLQWVAKSLRKVHIEYGRRCVGIQPFRSASGDITAWLAELADESTIRCRNLVIGIGRDPYIPAVFAALPRDRVIHSTEYSTRMIALDRTAIRNVAVIGGGQSAAEMLMAAYETLPQSRCTMVLRSIGLQSYEHSKFTNQLYYPSFVDDFFGSAPDMRQQILLEMRRTNYGALDPELLETIYRRLYVDRLSASERLQIRALTTVTHARMKGREVVLTLTDRTAGRTEELRCDVVMLGTGFTKGMPRMVRDFATAADLTTIKVNRAYGVITPPTVTASCYLQGLNEATHGIADSLLSVIALRSGEIVTDIAARHRAAIRPDAVDSPTPPGGGAVGTTDPGTPRRADARSGASSV